MRRAQGLQRIRAQQGLGRVVTLRRRYLGVANGLLLSRAQRDSKLRARRRRFAGGRAPLRFCHLGDYEYTDQQATVISIADRKTISTGPVESTWLCQRCQHSRRDQFGELKPDDSEFEARRSLAWSHADENGVVTETVAEYKRRIEEAAKRGRKRKA